MLEDLMLSEAVRVPLESTAALLVRRIGECRPQRMVLTRFGRPMIYVTIDVEEDAVYREVNFSARRGWQRDGDSEQDAIDALKADMLFELQRHGFEWLNADVEHARLLREELRL